MTSLASSDLPMTRHGVTRFPPRRELPPGVTIAKVPFLGRTWYERGFWYWCRRAAGVFVFTVTLAIYLGIIAGVVSAAGPAGSPGFVAVLVAESVFSLVTAVFAFRWLRRQDTSGLGPARRPMSARGGMSAFLVFQSGVVGGALLAVSALLTAGFALAMLAMWFTPVLPAEMRARRMLADRLELDHLRTSNMHHAARRRRRR
jgi:hypothetical protein